MTGTTAVFGLAGGTLPANMDGGPSTATYLPTQNIDGGNAWAVDSENANGGNAYGR